MMLNIRLSNKILVVIACIEDESKPGKLKMNKKIKFLPKAGVSIYMYFLISRSGVRCIICMCVLYY